MKIIRIERLQENGEYVGMYQGLSSLLEERLGIGMDQYRAIFEDNCRHPTPWNDPGLETGWRGILIFGFQTFFRFENWMTIKMLSTLAELGVFCVKVYEVGSEHVKCGQSQCVFDPDEAQCIFVGGIDKNYFNLLDKVKSVVLS